MPHQLPAIVRLLAVEIQDIAADAGLDPSTVSRAIHDKQALSAGAASRLEIALLKRLSDGARS